MSRKGQISIDTENIFPIIKKWMYSEKDIFIREIVSNASDAISKLKKVISMGEAESDGEPYRIDVDLNKTAKTISVSDNGIGMTEEEVEKYITQIAFSGAQDFAEKYANEGEDGGIIGHFGLGFYSAFMVSDLVEIDTLSYKEGSKAVHWESDGNTDYTIGEAERELRGTTVIMHLNDDCTEFLNLYELRNVLRKYFSFLPVEIYVTDVEEEAKRIAEKEKKAAEKAAKKEDEPADDESAESNESAESEPINDTHPLWLKSPSECTDEEYKEFYRKTFMDYNDPLFWVHINLDYPFNVKGILYFPKLKHEYETIEGQVKLYNNQVFVADNLKEVIPEFLTLLKGCIDCPDLPLNVSRSFLQNDGTVNKLSMHITKKVSDKLKELFRKEFDNYCKYWDDINPFVKYGCMKEEKFYDNVKDILIFKTIEDKYVTVDEYLKTDEAEGTAEGSAEEKPETVFYTDNIQEQGQYISMFKENGMDAIVLDTMIDSHFISFLEMKEEGKVRFMRIDSDITESMKGDEADVPDEDVKKKIIDMASAILDIESEEFKKENGTLKIEVQALKSSDIPSMLQQSEEARRMEQMSKMYGGMMQGMDFPKEETLVLNSSNDLVKQLGTMDKDDEKTAVICEQLYDLAVLTTRQLPPEKMKKFIERSTKLLID